MPSSSSNAVAQDIEYMDSVGAGAGARRGGGTRGRDARGGGGGGGGVVQCLALGGLTPPCLCVVASQGGVWISSTYVFLQNKFIKVVLKDLEHIKDFFRDLGNDMRWGGIAGHMRYYVCMANVDLMHRRIEVPHQ